MYSGRGALYILTDSCPYFVRAISAIILQKKLKNDLARKASCDLFVTYVIEHAKRVQTERS